MSESARAAPVFTYRAGFRVRERVPGAGVFGNVQTSAGKGYFSLKHQSTTYPHAELIKSTLARQETSNKTRHMETVRLL